MKKHMRLILIISFAILVFACRSTDEKTEEGTNAVFDFRNTSWGMTVDEVKSAEKSTPSAEGNGVIRYNEDYLGLPVIMGYVFKDGKLVKAVYFFKQDFVNPEEYIVSYEKIKGSLIDIYGPPSLDEVRWQNEESSDKTEASAETVCAGEAIYRTEWVTQKTLIALHLEGAGGKCRQGVIFESAENYKKEHKDQISQPETLQ